MQFIYWLVTELLRIIVPGTILIINFSSFLLKRKNLIFISQVNAEAIVSKLFLLLLKIC